MLFCRVNKKPPHIIEECKILTSLMVPSVEPAEAPNTVILYFFISKPRFRKDVII